MQKKSDTLVNKLEVEIEIKIDSTKSSLKIRIIIRFVKLQIDIYF